MNLLFLLLLLRCFLSSPPFFSPASAQRIPGFVSLDCGSAASSSSHLYTDTSTSLVWESDASFGIASASFTAPVSPPTSSSLSSSYLVSTAQLSSIRYFPGNQTKYCYTLDDSTYGIRFNATYLIRATFWAGSDVSAIPFSPKNPDGLLRLQLLINADVWTNVSIPFPQTDVVQKEVFVVALSSSLSVCLSGGQSVDRQLDTPFISSLEIRQIPVDEEDITPLHEAIRPSSATTRAVHTVYRLDYGSSTGISVRYPYDIYDRIWQSRTFTPEINTTSAITGLSVANHVPLSVMQTAYTNNVAYFYLNFTSPILSGSRGGYAYSLYFAEISDNVTAPGERVFNYAVSNDTSNGAVKFRNDIDLYGDDGKYTVICTYSSHRYITLDDGGYILFNFTRNETSTFGPLLSALELYKVSDHDDSSGTHEVDAAAVAGVVRAFPSALASWSGDPCLPYPYDWLLCGSLDVDGAPRIISLSLTHIGLSGVIPFAIANLTALQILDLQGNNLSGSIPDFLGSLPNLTTLNLQNNSFSGGIPSSLLGKLASRTLNLSVAGNPNIDLCGTPLNDSASSNSCNTLAKSHTKIPSLVGGSIGGAILLILVATVVFCLARKRLKAKENVNLDKDGSGIAIQAATKAEAAKVEDGNVISLGANQIYYFTYQDIENITNSFCRKLGRGGFGDVYHGRLRGGVEVAVKTSTKDFEQGKQDFLNEVALLSRAQHRNLVKLIGYCEDNKLMLVYEYMPNGSLQSILQENRPSSLGFTWRDRLKIAIGAADGLEYLHSGCTPPIIHGDVKSSNILLDATMEGKLSDFGISWSTLHSSSDRHRRGYLPPDIMDINKINDKVDVYAFGVVLFELITGRNPVFNDGFTKYHIADWVKSKTIGGDLGTIVDPTIGQTYNVSSMWRVIDVALMCLLPDNHRRPKMIEVSLELKIALTMELGRNEVS